jgi:hypothetical protein
MAAEKPIYGRGIGLRATHEEHNLGIGTAYSFTDKVTGLCAIPIEAIAHRMLHICT